MGLNPDNHSTAQVADLLIQLDAGSREGLQQQVYQGVRSAILDAVVSPGARLPSTRGLADDLGVSRTTTLLAYEQLLAEGYIAGRHGSGTFVVRELPDDRPPRAAPRRASRTRHPQLSQRGAALVGTPGSARRIAGPPRPFRLGAPALDLFPLRLWTQLVTRRLRSMRIGQLDYTDLAGFS